ncbi:phenylalanine--tRNA ligase subunit alpha [Chloroflexota bacterium]
MILKELEELNSEANLGLGQVGKYQELESWRVKYLGRKSKLTLILRSLASLSIEERREVGARANSIRLTLESALEQKNIALQDQVVVTSTGASEIDITLPGRSLPVGRLHPITRTLQEISDIFVSMGFQLVDGPEVETDYYNFEALNIPEEHPARDNMATMWISSNNEDNKKKYLLRTHTTSVSARIIETMKPPIRVINMGKVYRYEASDATHSHMFFQLDGLAVDKDITMADLKGTLFEFARRFFGEDRKVRFRCDYFPFVEPGIEIAVECAVCRGKGCRLCKNSGWIEILGAGMTHPRVLERGGIDPEEYQSFAFGMGIDRIPMLKYGIEDIRLFYGSDLRFLRQL